MSANSSKLSKTGPGCLPYAAYADCLGGRSLNLTFQSCISGEFFDLDANLSEACFILKDENEGDQA